MRDPVVRMLLASLWAIAACASLSRGSITPRFVLLASLWAIAACASPPPDADRDSAAAARPSRPAPSRTLTMAVQHEPPGLLPKSLTSTGRLDEVIRLFNATLAFGDQAGVPQPYLAEALPELHTASWRVSPDGRMETTYRLRPGLTWHDGQPLVAEDFAFAWRVYTAPGLGLFTPAPQDQMEDVAAADPRTVVIRWRTLYPEAGALRSRDLDPLPRHLLEHAFAALEQDPTGQKDSFANHPYWSSQYVGVGPYRLDRWEPASHLEALAFDAHSLGRPTIHRLLVRVIADENTVLANVLAENIDLALGLRFEHATILRRNWADGRGGVVLLVPGSNNTTLVQSRPEFLKAVELADQRVRRALAHAIDREALNDGLFEGQGLMGETYIVPTKSYYPELDRRLTKYPYDLRRTEQLMAEAGLGRGADGLYIGAAGERLALPYLVLGGGEKSLAIMTDLWRRAGFDIQPAVLPTGQTADAQARATFPALANTNATSTERVVQYFATAQIGSPANRWGGNNRGGWSNPDYDRLFEAYRSTLDRGEREQKVIEMMVMVSQQRPAFKLFFNVDVVAHLAALRGPEVGTPESLALWNIHEWELR